MDETNRTEVAIVRLYLKDLSFESPMAPSIFSKNITPEVQLRVGVRPKRVEEQMFEITLDLHIEGKTSDAVNFIVELEYAGLFAVRNVPEAHLDQVLLVFCPQILFPYARQIVDTAMINGGFPPMTLAPLDFEALRQSSAKNK